MRNERGQALVETAIFVPVMLMSIFALIFFSRVGILQERAEHAVRYGNQVSFDGAYTIEAMYDSLNAGVPIVHGTLCPGGVAVQTTAALTLGEGSNAYATPQPYWRPDSGATSACQLDTLAISSSGNAYMGFDYLTISEDSLAASLTAPAYLKAIFSAPFSINAQMNAVHSSPPNVFLHCTPFGAGPIAYSLSGNPNVGFAGFVQPSGNPHVC